MKQDPPVPEAPTPDVLPAGTRLGQYSIVRRIGTGGMASVYEARHEGLGKRVALKLLHPAYAVNAAGVERFLREARASSQLRHPHVVDVSDVGVENAAPYMVMEFLEGETLGSWIDRSGALPVPLIADLMLPVISAVAAAHAAGIVHRDLKPDNIFLAQGPHGSDRPVLLDFGISKLLPTDRSGPVPALTVAGQLIGTPHYMSPEQVRGGADVDARTDQYALGVILYECATGLRPFRTEQSLYLLLAEIVLGNADPPSRFRPSLPPAFDALVARAMATQPAQRFPSVTDLGRALLPFASAGAQVEWAREFGPERAPAVAAYGRAATLAAAAAGGQGSSGAVGARESTPPPPQTSVAQNEMAAAVVSGPLPGPPRRAATVAPRDLRTIEALADCSDAELEMFCVVAPAWAYPAGSMLFRQGAAGESCFLLLAGEVAVVKSHAEGETVLNRLRAGAVVGQIALVDRAPRSASVVARTDAVAVELGRDVFERLLAARSEIALRFQEQVAIAGIRQLRSSTLRLAALLEERAMARAAGVRPSLAPELSARFGRVQAAVFEWSLPVSEPAVGAAGAGAAAADEAGPTKKYPKQR